MRFAKREAEAQAMERQFFTPSPSTAAHSRPRGTSHLIPHTSYLIPHIATSRAKWRKICYTTRLKEF